MASRHISFRATCRKAYLNPFNNNQVIQCDETFVGEADKARYTEHMTTVHGLSIYRNCGIETPAWLRAKPYNFKASKPGTIAPKGVRRDALEAARDY